MKSSIIVLVQLLFHTTHALSFDLKDKNLSSVPQDIDPNVTNLNLDYNEIIRITNESLDLYRELVILSIKRSHVNFIEDGAFDYNSKLQRLNANGNRIIQLPQSFGSAARSLIRLSFSMAVEEPAISKLYLVEMKKLNSLTMGGAYFPGKLDAAILPSQLRFINLHNARLTQFPEFRISTPNMKVIVINTNRIR